VHIVSQNYTSNQANINSIMKSLNKIWGMAAIAIMLILSAPHKSMAQQEGQYISNQEFYDELQPYGTWIDDPQYGNVWVPDVEENFRPYATQGYWAMTSYGNTWVSDYPWGWATFHYGRWHFDNYYGWEWVPGSEWAPAWVSWRNGGGYYGWAPMEPGISIDMAFSDNYSVPDDYWVFAPNEYVNSVNVYNYYVPNYRVRNILGNTNWVRNRYRYDNHTYNSGPRSEDIQRYTHRPVRVYDINNVNRPSRITVNNNNINIYRPAVRQNTNARPARVVDGAAYRQQNPGQRIGGNDSRRGTVYNAANAARLAETARTANPDTKVVRVNNTDRRPGYNQSNNRSASPQSANQDNVNRTYRGNRPVVDNQQQQRVIDRQQANSQQQQMRNQQQQQVRQQQEQQRGGRPGVNNEAQVQRQQQDQQRQQQQQQQQQARQQQDQQRQQQQQVRQHQDQQRANRSTVNDGAQVQRQQQDQQRQQARQQQDQQRQQQQQDQQQQRQQQQARQQQDQQRQQQQARQQQDQQRQQQQAQDQQRQQQQQARQQQQQQVQEQRQQQQQAREQQRQQQDQQRQQQQQAQEQQRQQQDQQRQQQQQSAPSRRPVRE
jgi:hypothetical protein